MKKYLIYILAVSSLLFFNTCEENFSPKDELLEAYILNSIIRVNDDFQFASIHKTFDVQGFNPESDSLNPFVDGADITLTYRGEEYKFKDTVLTPLHEQRFDGPLKYYYLKNFKPIRDQEDIIIKAVLPDGKILKAAARVPILFEIDRGQSDQIIPSDFHPDFISVHWFPRSKVYFQYYKFRLRIKYEIHSDNESVINYVEVPIKKSNASEDNSIYPSLTKQISTSYPLELFEETMKKIGDDITDKKNIFITNKAEFEIVALDPNLAAYYFAGVTQNIYSVRFDQTLFSNVEGGFGIVGAMMERKFTISISDSFIRRFGYSVKN